MQPMQLPPFSSRELLILQRGDAHMQWLWKTGVRCGNVTFALFDYPGSPSNNVEYTVLTLLRQLHEYDFGQTEGAEAAGVAVAISGSAPKLGP